MTSTAQKSWWTEKIMYITFVCLFLLKKNVQDWSIRHVTCSGRRYCRSVMHVICHPALSGSRIVKLVYHSSSTVGLRDRIHQTYRCCHLPVVNNHNCMSPGQLNHSRWSTMSYLTRYLKRSTMWFSVPIHCLNYTNFSVKSQIDEKLLLCCIDCTILWK